MSHGSTHTLYNFGFPTVDLVITVNDIQVDNRPMNQQKLVFHRGLSNRVDFYVRDRDRKLQDLSNTALTASVINPNNGRRVLEKDLDVIDPANIVGQASLILSKSEVNTLDTGLYKIAITYVDTNGNANIEYPMYTNQNDRIVNDLEVRQGLDFLSFSEETAVFLDDDDTFVSDPFPGDQTREYTMTIDFDQFVGNVTVQGSLTPTTPSTDAVSDHWFDITTRNKTSAETGEDVFSFTEKVSWIRIKFTKDSGNIQKVKLTY